MIWGGSSSRRGRLLGAGLPCRRRTAARVGATSALLMLGVCGVFAAEDQNDVPLPDNPFAGRALIEGKHCLQCHGVAGAGASIGPSLGEGGFGGTFLELGAALWNHVPGMGVTMESAGLDWPELSPSEVTRLIVFLYSIDYLGRPGRAEAGELLFRTRGCAFCHSIGGGNDVGPDLAELTRFASPLNIAQGIWNHGPSMLDSMRAMGVAPPSFIEGDLADLSAFIRQRTGPGPQGRLLLAPGNPNRGRELFSAKGCASCHGSGGDGGGSGPSLRRADLHHSAEAIAGNMWNHALAMRDTMRDLGLGWPQFESSELADLVAYLYFLPFSDPPGDRERGARVFEDRACASCHSIETASPEGNAGKAPNLAGSLGGTSPAAFVSTLWNHAAVMRDVIIGEGLPWPELSGIDLRDLRAFLQAETTEP